MFSPLVGLDVFVLFGGPSSDAYAVVDLFGSSVWSGFWFPSGVDAVYGGCYVFVVGCVCGCHEDVVV